jgi:hypothetical protein
MPRRALGRASISSTAEAARAFAEGDLIAGLRSRPGVSDLAITAVTVDRDLSLAMGAAAALGVEPRGAVDGARSATAA